MALVAYDCSDCSDSDVEDEMCQTVNNCQVKCDSAEKISNTVLTIELGADKTENLFSNLPKPSLKELTEEDDEYLHKSESVKREKAKINIPSLSDFKDVEDISNKKKTFNQSGKKSGLLSILPEPKFSTNSIKKTSKPLIPNVVEKKIIKANPCPNIEKPTSTDSSNKSAVKPVNSLLTADYSDSDDDHENEHSSDFFSINTQHESLPATDDTVNLETVNITEHDIISEESNVMSCEQENNLSYDANNEFNSQQANPGQSAQIELDEEAIRQLCGSRNKHRKEQINMITVDQKQVLSDSREWLLKGLMDDTTRRVSASKRKGNEPTTQQRKKHQITYLAHQAKANEAELQNQWANNRMSKRQTQSKYGF